MATGLAWDVSNPTKPTAKFDKDAVRDIPFNWADWLTDIESTYASDTYSCSPELQIVSSTQLAGVIKLRVQVLAGQALVTGTKYFVTSHIIAADGQEDDQTLYLKATVK